jgi:hypothetical protein
MILDLKLNIDNFSPKPYFNIPHLDTILHLIDVYKNDTFIKPSLEVSLEESIFALGCINNNDFWKNAANLYFDINNPFTFEVVKSYPTILENRFYFKNSWVTETQKLEVRLLKVSVPYLKKIQEIFNIQNDKSTFIIIDAVIDGVSNFETIVKDITVVKLMSYKEYFEEIFMPTHIWLLPIFAVPYNMISAERVYEIAVEYLIKNNKDKCGNSSSYITRVIHNFCKCYH